MPETQKKLGQSHVYHYDTPRFLLIPLFNCLETEQTNSCSFASGLFLSLPPGYKTSQTRLLCAIHSQKETDLLQADQSSTCRLCSVEISTDFQEKDIALMAAYVSLKSHYTPQCRWYLHTYAGLPCRGH